MKNLLNLRSGDERDASWRTQPAHSCLRVLTWCGVHIVPLLRGTLDPLCLKQPWIDPIQEGACSQPATEQGPSQEVYADKGFYLQFSLSTRMYLPINRLTMGSLSS